MGLTLASYKLRSFDRHVRIVPALDDAGCAFAGPGVDLRGADADSIFALATPFREWLDVNEPGATLRAVSVDLVAPRVSMTLEPRSGAKATVRKLDAAESAALLERARALEDALVVCCAAALQRRLHPP